MRMATKGFNYTNKTTRPIRVLVWLNDKSNIRKAAIPLSVAAYVALTSYCLWVGL